jgi:peptidoglycan/LPS O-acetylase OafA/YrhL
MATTWSSPLHAAAAVAPATGPAAPSSAAPASIARPELKALTSLRFLAALMVFMDHAPVTEWASHHLGFGAAGVGFFFLLSGFVLMYSHGTDFAAGIRWPQVRKFYVARFARIYPAYLVALLTMTLALAALGKLRLAEAVPVFFAQMFLVQSWIHNELVYEGLNFVGWSISVEAFFYLLFPISALLIWRLSKHPRGIAIAAGVVLLTLAAVVTHIGPAYIKWSYVLPVVRFPEFFLGMLLAIAFFSAAKSGGTLREINVFLLAAVCVVLSPFAPYGLRLAAWMIPALAALLFTFATQRGAISNFLTAPAFVRLGEISFAFYLVHPLALLLVTDFTRSPLGISIGGLALALGLSFLMYGVVERPMRKRIVAALAVRPPQPATAAVPAPR